MTIRYIIFMLAILAGALASAAKETAKPAEKKTIYWLFFELPGGVNLKNGNESPGYIMEIYYLLKEKMPEYTHQVVEVPFLRSIQQMQKKKGVCSLMILKNPERDQFMFFGRTYMAGMPAGILASRENKKVQKHIVENKMVDIDDLLKDRDIQFGGAAGRFYGKKISESLKKHSSAKVLLKQGSEVDRELRNLLKLGRIDVYFGYPFEVIDNDLARFYFVRGNTEMLEPRIGCEKTPFGQEVIARTEEVRTKNNLDKEFAAIHERFFPKSMQDEFRKMTKGH